ncbi:hypothetical protein BH23PAT1_BH23PAT1_4670 [soil metagenome]
MSETIGPTETPASMRITGEIYDLIYCNKDYAAEAAKISDLIKHRCESGGNNILEAACGTGNYMQHLRGDFIVEGFDLAVGQVEEAKRKLPDMRIFQADMVDFEAGQTYDALICLFSSIGYLKTKERLDNAVANMAGHTNPGGLVIVEAWLKAEDFKDGHVSLEAVSNDAMSVARMGLSSKEGIVSTIDMHHMVGTSSGIEHIMERHQLAMYSDEDFTDAFTKAGLELEIDPTGLMGRRLCIGKKPL